MPQLPQSNPLNFYYVLLCFLLGDRPLIFCLTTVSERTIRAAKLWKSSEMMRKVHLFVVDDKMKLWESDRGGRWGRRRGGGGLLWNFTLLLWLILIFDVEGGGGGRVNGVWELQTWMWQHAAIQRRAAAAAAPGRQEAHTAPERRGGAGGRPAADGAGGGDCSSASTVMRAVRYVFLVFWVSETKCICWSSRVPKCCRRGCKQAQASRRDVSPSEPRTGFNAGCVGEFGKDYKVYLRERSSNTAEEPQQCTQTRFASFVIHIYCYQYYFKFEYTLVCHLKPLL